MGYAGTFNVTLEYLGSNLYLPSSDWEILVVNKVKTRLYAIFAPNPVDSGKVCILEGILVDQFSNPIRLAVVSLEYSTDYGLSWHPAGTLSTTPFGVFSQTFTAPSPGTYLVRMKCAGSTSHEASIAIIALIVH